MKRIQKGSELLWLLGTFFVALGVALCSKANLGVSMIAAPAFVIYDYVAPLWSGFSVGMIEYLIQCLLLILLCLIIRRWNWHYLLAFLVAVIYGYVLNFFLFIFRDITFAALWQKWVMLLIGDVATAFGVACYFRTYLPLQIYELFVSEVSTQFRYNVHQTKWIFDCSLLFVSIFLAVILFKDNEGFSLIMMTQGSYHNLGLGTLITTVINSPIIAIMGKIIDSVCDTTPLFPSVKRILFRKPSL